MIKQNKQIVLIPRINKSNGQMNFSLKKSELPMEIKYRLPSLKGIKLNMENFKFN